MCHDIVCRCLPSCTLTAVGRPLQADATVALLGGREGWVPTHNLTALLLLAVPGTLHSKIGLMFRLLDR